MRDRDRQGTSGARALRLALLAAIVSFTAVGLLVVGDRQPDAVVIGAGAVGGPTAAATPVPTPSATAPPAPSVDPDAPAVPVPAPQPLPTSEPLPTPTPTPALPALYVAHAAEEEPQLKEEAAHFVQALLTHTPGETPADVAERVAAEFGVPGAPLAERLGEVVHDGASSSAEILYPQLGGLRATTASVMVAVAQTVLLPDGGTLEESRTMDVRMAREDGGAWVVTSLESDGGPRTPRPADLGALEAAVVDHPRIDLPDSARWDIYRGLIAQPLLQRMLDMAERHAYAVNVLQTGHPYNVFGTDSVSHHSRGRAVDVYRVDGRLVIDDRTEGSPTYALARWIFDSGGPQLGAPWAFDPPGGRSFTDALHQDHLHIASAAR